MKPNLSAAAKLVRIAESLILTYPDSHERSAMLTSLAALRRKK